MNKYIKCVYCGKLYKFDMENNICHYQKNLTRCPNKPLSNRECFTCGEIRKRKFRDIYCEQVDGFRRCRHCIREGYVLRYQRYDKHVLTRGEQLMRAVKELNFEKVVDHLNTNVNPNFTSQLRLTDKEREYLGDGFNYYNDDYDTAFDRLWRSNGRPIRDTRDTEPTTPLKMAIHMISDNFMNDSAMIVIYNIVEILIEKGGRVEPAYNYWVHKYGEIDLKNPKSFMFLSIFILLISAIDL